MTRYHVWIGTFRQESFEEYWDNEPYETAVRQWKNGGGSQPGEELKCGFCREMGLEELEQMDVWFSVSTALRTARELAAIYLAAGDLDAFERACQRKGVLYGNVIWGVSVREFPHIEPSACQSMSYIGCVKFR